MAQSQTMSKSHFSRLAFKRSTIQRNINGWLFISPWLVGFLTLTLYPMLSSLYYSFTDYNVIQQPNWIGFNNYVRLLTNDPTFWTSVGNTLYYVALFVPLTVIFSIAIAMLLNTNVRGRSIFRTAVFLPSMVPEIVTGLLWFWMLNPQFGFANTLLKFLGIPTIGWLSDPAWSKPSLVLIGLWGLGGSMVIYLAALQDIPEHLYEAADIDGAGVWTRTRYITLPLLTPTILFNLVLGIINAFQTFTSVFVITKGTGGPIDSTLFYGLILYRNAFTYLKMGYASAMAWLLFLVIVLITAVIFWTSRRWVFYSGDAS
ncbi:MAG: sugar ABC transporter permease [Anaerolineae bacterium]|nr:sugar ABC transporter permease [Anaerolineae bacterium]